MSAILTNYYVRDLVTGLIHYIRASLDDSCYRGCDGRDNFCDMSGLERIATPKLVTCLGCVRWLVENPDGEPR